MSNFSAKLFEGVEYQFGHLTPFVADIPLGKHANKSLKVHVAFGCHCFTESFDDAVHLDHHRYTHRGELRAFNVLRYNCSLQLRQVIEGLFSGRIYRGDGSYTYVAHIVVGAGQAAQAYSIFFSLSCDRRAGTLKMFIKSAYPKPLTSSPGAQSWRFVSLAGQLAGAFDKAPKSRPIKKAP